MSVMRVRSFRLKKPEEIEKMRASGRILGGCLREVSAATRPGITTDDLNVVADTYIKDHGCIPGFVGYQGFPKSICISVNDEVVHGIPGPRRIEDGDLVSLDCGLILDRWWADSGCSVIAGTARPAVTRLVEVTREAMHRGIAQARPGNRIGAIGHAVQSYAEAEGFGVVRNYVGHGIGRDMHEAPEVPNYGTPDLGNEIKAGLVLAIEPMVNVGSHEVDVLDDDWTVVTRDGSLSCYFEHTVAITDEGPEILTIRPGEADERP